MVAIGCNPNVPIDTTTPSRPTRGTGRSKQTEKSDSLLPQPPKVNQTGGAQPLPLSAPGFLSHSLSHCLTHSPTLHTWFAPTTDSSRPRSMAPHVTEQRYHARGMGCDLRCRHGSVATCPSSTRGKKWATKIHGALPSPSSFLVVGEPPPSLCTGILYIVVYVCVHISQ
jgi:hypothetical protein